MTLRQSQPLPYVPLNDQNPNFLHAWRRRKFGFPEVTFWTKEAFKVKTSQKRLSPLMLLLRYCKKSHRKEQSYDS
jgi:hypothetical protein